MPSNSCLDSSPGMIRCEIEDVTQNFRRFTATRPIGSGAKNRTETCDQPRRICLENFNYYLIKFVIRWWLETTPSWHFVSWILSNVSKSVKSFLFHVIWIFFERCSRKINDILKRSLSGNIQKKKISPFKQLCSCNVEVCPIQFNDGRCDCIMFYYRCSRGTKPSK